MKSHIAAIRAVTVEFAMQFIRLFVWWGLGIIGGLLIVVAILAFTVSQWWWLLALPIVVLGLVGAVVWLIVRFIATQLSPKLNPQQKVATKKFVTKLQTTTEAIQTPYPVIVFYIIRDIILRKDSGFIAMLVQDSKYLRPDFEQLVKSFK